MTVVRTSVAEVRSVLTKDVSYNETAKKRFARVAKRYLKSLAESLELEEFEVYYNPGGIAVFGEAILRGMWDEGNGIYVEISQFGGQPIYMYRSIRHMRDCSGGPNHHIWDYMGESRRISDGEIYEKLIRLRR